MAKTLRIYPTERNADLTIKLVESDTRFGDDDVVFELARSVRYAVLDYLLRV